LIEEPILDFKYHKNAYKKTVETLGIAKKLRTKLWP
jgi:hypothetical protein